MSKTEQSVNTCVIITEIVMDHEQTIVGALADSVLEVIDLDAGHIEPAPRLGTRLDTNFLKGIGKHNEQFIMVLDINLVFSTNELSLVQSAHELETQP
jgi:purine-binding chemotaxis protein CheW